ncbi:MAG TPA: HAMP domain-containing sensor histidine kinase, partial [Clostridia bacterium]|nr:HAMP domain-containing sensor histidine kinase [Clostridia bacterium]
SGYMKQNESGSVLLICNTLSLLSSAIDADIYIANTDGNVIYCRDLLRADMVVMPGTCNIHGKYYLPKQVIELAIATGNYSEISDLDGVYDNPHLVVAKPIFAGEQAIGIVFAVQPIAALLGPYVISMLRMFGFASLLAMAIAFITVYYMIYRVTKPLRQMSAATRRFAAGDFNYRVKVDGNDELSELAAGFNSMAKDLATLESSRRNFVANVSHELKTPMTTIGGFIDGMLDGTIEVEKRAYYLNIVSDEIKRLSRLVTGMLNMSKIEAGEVTLKPKSFDIAEQIFKTALSFEQIIEKKKITIFGLDQMTSVYLSADESMINQVIYNLVDNAVKFTPTCGYIYLAAYEDNGNVVVKIKNTGVGISSEEIGRVFEQFYKVDRARSYDVKGTGLGLYIVKSIIELHGGTISVSSIENQYTEFAFVLPIK